MTTIEYLKREIHRTELSIRQAERKPNTPPEELRGLQEKLEHLQEARKAVEEHWQRVHEKRGWTAVADVRPVVRGRWEFVKGSNGKEYMVCSECRVQQDLTGVFTYCPNCGAIMVWEEEATNDRH